jgi:hypothetical protein
MWLVDIVLDTAGLDIGSHGYVFLSLFKTLSRITQATLIINLYFDKNILEYKVIVS